MNQVLARKIVTTVLSVLAGVLQAPRLVRLPVAVVVSDEAHTAATGLQRGQAQITLPTHFAGVAVESDTPLYLGLTAHEIAHLPDLPAVLRLLEQAQQTGGAALAGLFNLIEDIRIESALRAAPVNDWLTRARTLVAQRLSPTPGADFWELMLWLRFGNPAEPYSLGLPPGSADLVAADGGHYVYAFWEEVREVLARRLGQGPLGSYRAAVELLLKAQAYLGYTPADPPPDWSMAIGGPQGAADDLGLDPLAVTGPALAGEDLEWGPVDQAAIAQGQQLARRLTWWTPGRARAIAGGVGQYQPRLDREGGLPPYTLPLAPAIAPPPRLVICLDLSGSMWETSRKKPTNPRLALARSAAIAVWLAAQQAGGEARVYGFSSRPQATPLSDLAKIAAARGAGTNLEFLTTLPTLLPQPREWQYLFLTDAEVESVPAAWDAGYRARSTVLLIASDHVSEARALGDRVLSLTRVADLPLLAALAARQSFAVAGRV